MRSRPRLLIAALAGVIIAFAFAAPGSAAAETLTQLPITTFNQMVVDSAHDHIFITQANSPVNDVIVTNMVGQEITTIGGQDEVVDMLLSPDSNTLYAALYSQHAVIAISTATLKQTAEYPLGSMNSPVDLALQSGKLWVSYSAGPNAGSGAIGDIDLSAATPKFEIQSAMGKWYYAPMIAADPKDTGALVADAPGISPTPIASYDVSTNPVTVRAQQLAGGNCEETANVVVLPGGTEFIGCQGKILSTMDLSQLASYKANIPSAFAVTPSGEVALSADYGEFWHINAYKNGQTTPANSYGLASSLLSVPWGGLDWSKDGTHLYAIVAQRSSTAGVPTVYYLDVFNYPTMQATSLTISGPGKDSYGSYATITANLGITYTNRNVSIYAQNFGSGTKTLLKTGPVDSSGDLRVLYRVTRNTVFTATFAGDSQYAPATAILTTMVPAYVFESQSGYYGSKLTGNGIWYKLYHHDKSLTAEAIVKPAKPHECIDFEYQEYIQKAWHDWSLPCTSLNSSSQVTLSLALSGAAIGAPYRIRADFIRSATDTTNLNNDSAWQYFMVEK